MNKKGVIVVAEGHHRTASQELRYCLVQGRNAHFRQQPFDTRACIVQTRFYGVLGDTENLRNFVDGLFVVVDQVDDLSMYRLLRDLQQSLGKSVTIKPDAHLHHEQFDVMAM